MIVVQLDSDQLSDLIQNSVRKVLVETKPKAVETDKELEQLLTVSQAAALLHLTVPTIYSKHSKGELPGVSKRGKRLYFSKQCLIDWVKEGRKKSNTEIEQEAEAYLLNNKKGLNNGN